MLHSLGSYVTFNIKHLNQMQFYYRKGRLAMLGFVIGVATEYLTHKGILAQLGLM